MPQDWTRRLICGGMAALGTGVHATLTRAAQPSRPKADILIVGAGTAGCILAARLAADSARRRVLLIEAGGQDDDPRIGDPQFWPALAGGPFDWGYATQPQAGLDGRVLAYPRGKVLGGSSSINALGHQRGHSAIFDAWAAQGCKGWGFSDLLPYFKASEAFDGGADAWRGGGGPIPVVRPAAGDRSAYAQAFIDGAQARGHGFNTDFNGRTMAGVAWNQLAMRDGRRASEAGAYLHPALHYPNLTLLTGAQVLGLAFEADRCVGVNVAVGGRAEPFYAAETVLCAGAIDSPRLLMLSGVGAPEDLAAIGIKPRVRAPGVGMNLHDHPLCGVVYAAARALPASHYNHGEAVLFAQSGLSGNAAPDIQIMAVDAPFTTAATGPAPARSYSLVPCMMQPQSRGRVSLASSDPRAPDRIDPNYLSESADVDRFLAAFELALDVGSSAPMATWRAGLAMPGPAVKGRADTLAYIRKAVSPFFHPVGTCRMGSDAESVVDLELRVRGVSGLRVVDASVIPTIPNAMPNATVAAIAEKAAVLISVGTVHTG